MTRRLDCSGRTEKRISLTAHGAFVQAGYRWPFSHHALGTSIPPSDLYCEPQETRKRVHGHRTFPMCVIQSCIVISPIVQPSQSLSPPPPMVPCR